MNTIGKSEILAEAVRLRSCFIEAGAQLVDADILQPAETLLDLYGEDIRARAYVTNDPSRGEMMLRPDFTVPVVQQHMDGGAAPARYTYMGEIFRKQEEHPERPSEYLQVGFEVFDNDAPEAADAEVFALLSDLVSDLPLRATTGDISVLSAAIDGLRLPEKRHNALMRHLWRPRRFRALLDRFSGKTRPGSQREALLKAHAEGQDLISEAGIFIGLRNPDEIRTRLDRLVADAQEPPISEGELDLLEQVVSLKETAPAALEQLGDIAVDVPEMLPAVQRLDRRLEAMQARGIDVDALPFETSFGRTTMEYYDGFIFGLAARDRPGTPLVASGGRYDALTRVLGKGREIPAVGGIIRPATVLQLRNEGRS